MLGAPRSHRHDTRPTWTAWHPIRPKLCPQRPDPRPNRPDLRLSRSRQRGRRPRRYPRTPTPRFMPMRRPPLRRERRVALSRPARYALECDKRDHNQVRSNVDDVRTDAAQARTSVKPPPMVRTVGGGAVPAQEAAAAQRHSISDVIRSACIAPSGVRVSPYPVRTVNAVPPGPTYCCRPDWAPSAMGLVGRRRAGRAVLFGILHRGGGEVARWGRWVGPQVNVEHADEAPLTTHLAAFSAFICGPSLWILPHVKAAATGAA
jgi:hypothetical protein